MLLVCISVAVVAGFFCGAIAAETKNIQRTLNIGEYIPSLPSQLHDRHGKLITEFFADERREIISINALPKHVLYAVITKEDRTFFTHRGFSIKGFLRAAWNIFAGNYFSGGSTISQQVAGNLYEDRSVSTLWRKLKELWWSLQLEKTRSKLEILQLYLNNSPFGHGTYGVESASRFYFGHSSRELTLSEAAAIVAPLSSKSLNSLITNPNRVKKIQKSTLDSMVLLGYASKDEAERSFDEYWRSYDLTRPNTSNALSERFDKAPYFSDYVRDQFETLFSGDLDLYTDGYIIHTTLDLDYQREAVRIMDSALTVLSARQQTQKALLQQFTEERFYSLLELLSLTLTIYELDFEPRRRKERADQAVEEKLLPVLEVLSLMTGMDKLQYTLNILHGKKEKELRQATVESALVTLQNDTGYILAMVGGSDSGTNQPNRVVSGRVQTGSTLMPLYYASAIDARLITPATLLYGIPVAAGINNESISQVYVGSSTPAVSARTALSQSLDIPSLKVLDLLGLPTAAEEISQFLDIGSGVGDIPASLSSAIGMGISGISPLQMSAAFTVFPNLGRPVEPMAISYIEDRYGNVIYNNEQEVLNRVARRPNVVGADTAYLITDMLKSAVSEGTLSRRITEEGGIGDIPMVAKTGTALNWSDAWTVGYSPYYTTAVWFGFDAPGGSLGRYQTGSLTAGPAWIKYMKSIHSDLPIKDFVEPSGGIIERKVCAVSGNLPTEYCNEGLKLELFLTGTEPNTLCEYHPAISEFYKRMILRMKNRFRLSELPLPPNPGAEPFLK